MTSINTSNSISLLKSNLLTPLYIIMCLNKRDWALKEINFDIIPRPNQQVKFLIGCVIFHYSFLIEKIQPYDKNRKGMCEFSTDFHRIQY